MFSVSFWGNLALQNEKQKQNKTKEIKTLFLLQKEEKINFKINKITRSFTIY